VNSAQRLIFLKNFLFFFTTFALTAFALFGCVQTSRQPTPTPATGIQVSTPTLATVRTEVDSSLDSFDASLNETITESELDVLPNEFDTSLNET